MKIVGKMNKESIEDARLNGTTTEHVRQLVEPEINMADEKPRESGTMF